MLRKNYVAVCVKLTITAGLLYIVADNTDLAKVWIRLRQTAPLFLLGGLIILLIQALFMTRRWQRLMQFMNINWCYPRTLKVVMASLFFNQTLPSTVGGDAVRTWYLYKHGCGIGVATINVLLDRVCAFSALLIMAVISLPLLFDLVADGVARLGIVLLLGSMGLVLLGILFLDCLPNTLGRWKVVQGFFSLSHNARRLLSKHNVIGEMLLLSVMVHMLTVLLLYVLAYAINIEVIFSALLVIVPPLLFVSMLPISIAGWGLREGAMVVGLGYVGVSSENAFALSVLFGLAMMMIGLLGGIVWLFYRREVYDQQYEQSA